MSTDMDEACNRTACKGWHEHVYWDHQPRRVKFCKTLIRDFSQCMSIPKKFVTRFKGKLPETIVVKDPGGNVWHIGLAKVAGNTFLQYGWEEFVEAHHLEKKDILFFEYEGDSCFRVSMFDSSECERESSYFAKYKSSTKRKIVQEVPQEISDSDVAASIHNLEEPSSSKKYTRVKSCCVGRDKQNVLILKSETAETSVRGNEPGKEPLFTEVMQLALAFQPTRPSFISQMRKYHIRRKHFLNIPSEFAKKYLPNRNMEIILHLPNGKETWKVNFYFSENSFYYSKWRCFFEDNALEQGDVCVFEHSGSLKQIAMAVDIFRVKSGGN